MNRLFIASLKRVYRKENTKFNIKFTVNTQSKCDKRRRCSKFELNSTTVSQCRKTTHYQIPMQMVVGSSLRFDCLSFTKKNIQFLKRPSNTGFIG